jgi:hypothetical protein
MPHPANRRNGLQLVRGQTKVTEIVVKTKAGRPAKLTGAKLYLTVRQRADTDVIIALSSPNTGIEITDAAKGVAVATMSTTQTELLEAGDYVYDVWVVYPGDPPVRQPVVRMATLKVIDGLTDFSTT